jgi:hypothetical protein
MHEWLANRRRASNFDWEPADTYAKACEIAASIKRRKAFEGSVLTDCKLCHPEPEQWATTIAQSLAFHEPSKWEEIMLEEFWFRIHDDGSERITNRDPAPIRELRVVVTDGFEETCTSIGSHALVGSAESTTRQALGGDGHWRQHATAAQISWSLIPSRHGVWVCLQRIILPGQNRNVAFPHLASWQR